MSIRTPEAVIAGQADHRKQRIRGSRLMQQPQRIVSAAVIDKHDLTAGCNTPGLLQTPQFTAKHLRFFQKRNGHDVL